MAKTTIIKKKPGSSHPAPRGTRMAMRAAAKAVAIKGAAAMAEKADAPRLYRYVVRQTCRGQTGWIGQCTDQSGKPIVVCGRCSRQQDAAKRVLEYLNARDKKAGTTWPLADLTLKDKVATGKRGLAAKAAQQACPGLRQSTYKYVYWHCDKQRWEARVGTESLGYFVQESAAAQQACLGD